MRLAYTATERKALPLDNQLMGERKDERCEAAPTDNSQDATEQGYQSEGDQPKDRSRLRIPTQIVH